MDRKYIFLITYLFSSSIHAGDDLKNGDDIKKISPPYQITLPISIPKTPLNSLYADMWPDWSYERSPSTSSENSYDSDGDTQPYYGNDYRSSDSENEDWHSHAEYQNEHKGDN
jgi:hypothetical protein